MTVPITPGSDPHAHQPTGGSDVVKKTAIGTITVIVTLVVIFCVLPMVACGLFAALGSMSDQ